MTEREVCNCSWKDCAWISEQIALHAPDKHVWRGPWFSWRQRVKSPSTMCEKMLFLASSYHHVDGIEEFLQSGGKSSKNGARGIKKELKLAPHHFPMAIYEYMAIMNFKKVPTLLTATQMGIVAKLDNQKQRLMETVNLVQKMDALLREMILPPGGLLEAYVDNALTKLEGKQDHFVCAPVVTPEEALIEVKSWSRKRKERVPVTIVPKVSKTARLLPGATLHTTKMAALLKAAEEATLHKAAEQAEIAQAAEAIVIKRQGAEDVLLEAAKEAAELKATAEAKNIPVPIDILSPDLIPSVTLLSDKIKAKIKDMGIGRATCDGKCIRYIQMLRKYHSYFIPIPILDVDLLYPCKNVNRQNKDCIKFRISRRYFKDGMSCEDCGKKEKLKANVPLAKAAFATEVLAEISDHCRNELKEKLAHNNLDPERDERKGYDVVGGRGTGVRFLHYTTVFRKAIPLDADSKLKYKPILSDICLLEYLSVMHTIFIERIVNKKWKIKLENIETEIAAIKEAISLLVAWQEEKTQFQANSPKGAPKTSWQRHLLAWKTFRNLRVGVGGFFGYARDVLKRYGEDLFFVPALHSNQSMIESYFGKMRAHGHDYPSKVHVAASASNALGVINSGKRIVDVESGAKMRDNQYNSWRTKRLDFTAEDSPLLRQTSSLQPKTTLGKLVLDRLNGMATGGFANFLQANTMLADHAKLSIGTSQEEFFECIVQQKCGAVFGRKCQSAIEWCWRTLDESLDAPNNSPRRPYFFNLYKRLVELNKETDKELEEVPQLNNNIGWSTIHLVIAKFVLGQVALVFDSLRHKLRPTSVSEDTVDCLKTVRTDINRFCGWSLFSIRTLMMDGKWSQQFDDEDRDTLIRLLHDMSTRERDIVNNKQYIEDYYPFVERIVNEGGLTLWSPKYIDLGFSLLASITDQLSFDELRSKGNGYAKAVRLEVIKAVEKDMLPKFLELSSNITDDRELRRPLFFQIVDKTFHCRTSAFLKFYSSVTKYRCARRAQRTCEYNRKR